MIRGLPKNTEFKKLLIELVELFKPKVYMELGTKKGYIFNAIASKVDKAIGVDYAGFSSIIYKEGKTLLFQLKTDDFARMWEATPDNEVDFLFIDACHEKNQVLRDFNNFSKFVKEGTGLIFMHDTHPIREDLLDSGYCHNANEAAWEIRTNEKYRKKFEIVTLPGPWFGLTIIRKSSKQLAWR